MAKGLSFEFIVSTTYSIFEYVIIGKIGPNISSVNDSESSLGFKMIVGSTYLISFFTLPPHKI